MLITNSHFQHLQHQQLDVGTHIFTMTIQEETDEEFRSPETDLLVQFSSIEVVFIRPRKNLSKILSKTMIVGSSCSSCEVDVIGEG